MIYGEEYMSDNIICRMEHAVVKAEQGAGLKDVSFEIAAKHLTALISEDDSAGEVLKVMAGLEDIQSGKVEYPGLKSAWTGKRAHMQPEDEAALSETADRSGKGKRSGAKGKGSRAGAKGKQSGKVAYSRLKAVTRGGEAGSMEHNHSPEPIQYLSAQEKQLTVALQAMMTKPELLLLDRPYDGLNGQDYKQLLKEVITMYAAGSSVVIAAEHYGDVVLPCNDYVFLKEGRVIAQYGKNELPRPAKVITLWGGKTSCFLPEKMTMLDRRNGYCRFLYRESDMKELALRLSMTECVNVNIDELTMEEMLFNDYERWRA